MHLVGNVAGEPAFYMTTLLIPEDRLLMAYPFCEDIVRTKIFILPQHMVLFRAMRTKKLKKAKFKEIIFADTIPIPEGKNVTEHENNFSIAPLLASVIHAIHTGKPLTPIINP